jgi:hypothetical protein
MASMNASLARFLRRGELAGIAPGISRLAVERVLGPPDESGGASQRSTIDCYARRRVQVTYVNRIVVLVAVYLPIVGPVVSPVVIGNASVVDDLPADAVRDIDRFIRWLEDEDLEIRRWADASGMVRVTGGATAIFEEGQLVSVQTSAQAET